MDPRHIIHLEGGRLASTPRDLVRDTFRRLHADPQGHRLVFHIHGGLVPVADGLAIAERLLPVYRQAGCFPFFIVWESGIHETLVNNLHEIAAEGFFRALLRLVLKFGKAKVDQARLGTGSVAALTIDDGACEVEFDALASGEEPYSSVGVNGSSSVTPLSAREERQFRDALERDPAIVREASRISASLALLPEVSPGHGWRTLGTLIVPAVLREVWQEVRARPDGLFALPDRLVSGAIRALCRTVNRLATGRDHGLYPTAFEEVLREFYLGDVITGIWELMKRDAADAFEPDGARFGGTALLDELAAGWGAGYRPDLCLVGHSAGTIFACRWLEHACSRLPREAACDVVMLAPAATVDLFAEVAGGPEASIGRIRLFGLADAVERRDALVPGVYPRSVLYFVSGLLEGTADRPLLGMQRYHSAQPTFDRLGHPGIRRVLDLLAQNSGATIWSPQDGGPGHSSGATSHGSFDDDATTLESVVRFIASSGSGSGTRDHGNRSASSLDPLPAA